MKGFKTTVCVICRRVHDTALNCPDHQAICNLCRAVIEKNKLKNVGRDKSLQ